MRELIDRLDQSGGATQPSTTRRKWAAVLGLIAAWTWTILAGGGGVMLLMEKGPWPLTNGWFALCSGIAACPLTAWAAKRRFGVTVSRRAQFVGAGLIWLAGQVARRLAG